MRPPPSERQREVFVNVHEQAACVLGRPGFLKVSNNREILKQGVQTSPGGCTGSISGEFQHQALRSLFRLTLLDPVVAPVAPSTLNCPVILL